MPKYLLLLQAQHYAYTVAFILFFSKIILLYSCCAKEGLVYIAIAALSSRQSSFCFKCTKLNIYIAYNVQSASNAKYIYTYYINL